jgi:hypothetical protein
MILQFSGADVSALDGVVYYDNPAPTTTTQVAASITAFAANEMLVVAYVDNFETFKNSPPGMSAGPSCDQSGAGGFWHSSFYQSLTASGATGTRTSSLAGGTSWCTAVSLLIKTAPPPPVWSGLVYASVSGSSPTLHVVDNGTSSIITTLSPGFDAISIAASPDNNWLALASNAPQIQFMNTSTQAFGPIITTGLNNVVALVWAHDSSVVYCVGQYGVQTCTPSGTLGSVGVVSDAGTNFQAALAPDGAHIYVGADPKVYELTTSLFAFTHTYPGLSRSVAICVSSDGRTLYVTDFLSPGTLYFIDIATGAMTSEGANNNPGWMMLSADGTKLWCAEQASGLVQVFDASSGAVLQSIAAPAARRLALTPDGLTMWVGTFGAPTGRLFPVDTATYAVGAGLSGLGAVYSLAILPPPPGPPPPPSGTVAVALGFMIAVGSGSLPPPVITGSTITGTAVLNIGPLTVIAADHITTRTGTSHIVIGPLQLASVGARLGPGGSPIPGYRGRWRLTLHSRAFAPATLASTMIGELADARARKLEQAWNTPAVLSFTLDGESQAALLIHELLHDVVAWRWDDQTGQEFAVFRGPITQSADTLDEQSHVTTYTCHDYAAVLQRRLLTTTYTVTARDQDLIAGDFLSAASSASTSSGTSLSPASYLPVTLATLAADGTVRGLSGKTRDRTYYGSQNIGQALDDLSKVIDGFDFDVQPSAVNTTDSLRIFYPQQGVVRTGMALQYGSTVARVSRTVDSSEYSNYVRVLGNNASSAPTPQFFSERWNTQAHTISPTPIGLWMLADDASDVTIQSTLDDKAAGDLFLDGSLVPHYTLTLSPGAYSWGNPNMGDVMSIIIQHGRLNENVGMRVLGITYDIGDDGQEDVELIVSRPPMTFRKLFSQADRDVKALARR